MKKFDKNDGLNDKDRSIIGSLLSEISWEGSKTTRYRNGGAGLENVLTTEVLQILYFLPRTHFLGEIVKNLHTENNNALETLYSEIESSDFILFPGNHYLIDEPLSHQSGLAVQPDSLIISNSVYALIEIKRIKTSSFQKEQLAREFYLVTREAKSKTPLLVLIVNKKPPVRVSGHGRVEPKDFIKQTLPGVYGKADSSTLSLTEMIDLVDKHIAWITWEEIYEIIKKQKDLYSTKDKSLESSIFRLCNALMDAIERHS